MIVEIPDQWTKIRDYCVKMGGKGNLPGLSSYDGWINKPGERSPIYNQLILVLNQESFVRQHDLSEVWHRLTKSMEGLKFQAIV
jgi:hypothetical protein